MPSLPPARSIPARLAAGVEAYLFWLILAAVAVGLAVPRLAVVTEASTPLLAVMIGAVSLTLSVEAFRAVDGRSLAVIVLVQTTMPAAAYALARGFGLSPALVVGFVVLGAVTPELVAPVMTDLADGDTALATAALVVVGLGTVALVPAAVSLLGGAVRFDRLRIVEQLLLAVVLPMAAAVSLRHRFPDRIGRYDDYYPAVSALTVIVVIGGVAAANAGLVRANLGLLGSVVLAAAALNGYGYLAGWIAGRGFDRGERVAATFSVGMRDFAVAAALVVAAGFPEAASLPAVAFGVVEMASSAALARRFRG